MHVNFLTAALVFASKYVTEVNSAVCCSGLATVASCQGQTDIGCDWYDQDSSVYALHLANTGDANQMCFAPGYVACLTGTAANLADCVPPLTDCDDAPAPETTTTTVEAGTPGSVGDEINKDSDLACSGNSADCWVESGNADINYSPSHITFTNPGEVWNAEAGACCYKYTSEYVGTTNCQGKTPEQSHLVFDIECPIGDFSFSSASVPGNLGYGLDGSTCYWGIKIDEECPAGDTCEYEICLEYSRLEDGVCPTTTSWVMDKAGDAFSFNSLQGGSPSCTPTSICSNLLPGCHEFSVQGVQLLMGESAMMIASHQLLAACAVIMVLVVAGLWYRRKHANKGDGYQLVSDGPANYSTFAKV